MTWDDAREIAIALAERHPDVKPLAIRFTDLHRWVLELPGFTGKAAESNEKILEGIQMAWVDEVEE